MGYFKSIGEIKKVVEERKNESPTEKSQRIREETSQRLLEEKRRAEEAAKVRQEALKAFIESRGVYQAGYEAALAADDEPSRCTFQRILNLLDQVSSVDNLSDIKEEGLSLLSIQRLMPDDNGKVDIEQAQLALFEPGRG